MLAHCDPMDCSTPGSPVIQYLWEFPHIHVHLIIDSIQPSYPLSPLSPQSSPASGSSSISWLFISSGRSIRASASVSALSMNIQGWFPLGLTGLISLLSKGLSTVFSSTTMWKHQSSMLSLLYDPTLTFVHDYWKTIALTIQTFVGKVMP